jgi:hypothetical protein
MNYNNNDEDDDDDEYEQEAYIIAHSSDEDDEKDIIDENASHLFQALNAEFEINLIFDEENTQSQGQICSLDLESRKTEIKGLVNNARASLALDDRCPAMTINDIIELVFGPPGGQRYSSQFYRLLAKRLIGVTRNESNPNDSIQAWEIEAFIEAQLLLHVYQISPQSLWDSPAGWYKIPLLTKDRYSSIIQKLNASTRDSNEHYDSKWKPRTLEQILPDLIAAIRALATQSRDLTYDRKISLISLDDEKEKMRSKSVTSKGLSRTYQRSGNPGPTMFAGVSKTTGMLLSAEFQNLGESTQACAKRALASK